MTESNSVNTKRLFTIKRIKGILKKNDFNDDFNLDIMSRNAEKSLINYAVSYCKWLKQPINWKNLTFSSQYRQGYLKIINNLDKNSNAPLVIQMLKNREIVIQNIVFSGYDILDPENWDKFKKLAKKTSTNIVVKPPDLKTMADGFHKCFKCASQRKPAYKTTFYEMQTRSADEPMTQFITCHSCGNRWKQ